LAAAAACGISVANLYYNQPLLAQMAAAFRADTSFLPTFTQFGTGLVMFLFVPLGDMREKRGLICAVSLAAHCLTAVAPTIFVMTAASFLVGITAVVPHLILPFAAQMARPEERGRVLGMVLSGLLIGILLARTLSGFLAAALGWRAVYWFAAAVMLVLAGVLRATLPESKPSERLTCSGLLGSMRRLVANEPLLREAAVIGGLLFGCISAFWATLVFVVSSPPYHHGSRMAGMFGLIGLAGALAASVAGRVADQMRIYGIDPGARSRVNTVYMVTYFDGAVGDGGSGVGKIWVDGRECHRVALSAAAGLVMIVGPPRPRAGRTPASTTKENTGQ